jgi:hypothetical protein
MTVGARKPAPNTGGYYTSEYGEVNGQTTGEATMRHKWDEIRGIGRSFGYNQVEDLDDYLSSDSLVHMLVNIVSKGGNLTLNVGPHGRRAHPGNHAAAPPGRGQLAECKRGSHLRHHALAVDGGRQQRPLHPQGQHAVRHCAALARANGWCWKRRSCRRTPR